MDIQALKQEIGKPEFIDGVIVFPNLDKEYIHLSNKECNEIADYLCDTDDPDMLYILINACQLYTIRLCWSIHYASDMPIEDIQQEIADHTIFVLKKWKLRRTTDNPITNFRQNVSFRLRDVNRNKYDRQYSKSGQDKIEYRVDHKQNTSLTVGVSNDSYKYLYQYVLQKYSYNKAFIIFNKRIGMKPSISGLDLSNKETSDSLNITSKQLDRLNIEIKAQLRADSEFYELLKDGLNKTYKEEPILI